MILDPWPHIIIDDFLSKDDLLTFQQQCIDYNENVVLPEIKKNGPVEGHYRSVFQNDPLEAYGIMELFDKFETKRPYKDLSKLVQIVKTCDGCNYEIHEDAPHKIFSLVIYLNPEENIGTNFYNSNKEFSCKIDWKVNRAVMFCPLNGTTYHDYGSTTSRYTLMYNLVDR